MSIKNMLPPSSKRVELSTADHINQRIKERTIDSITLYKNADSKALTERIGQLDREWDTERTLEANASTIILISTILGVRGKRCWFGLAGVVSLFLLQHSLQGWCPPLAVIRRLGIRTREEIRHEKSAMKYLRGDFSSLTDNPEEILEKMSKS